MPISRSNKIWLKRKAQIRQWHLEHPNGATPIPHIPLEQRQREWKNLHLLEQDGIDSLIRFVNLLPQKFRPMLLGGDPLDS